MCGIDTETGSVATKFDKGGIALIQMSSEVNCYLFDAIALKDSEIFKDHLVTFFADAEILKVLNIPSTKFPPPYQNLTTHPIIARLRIQG